jgi:6-phosphogluconolactonase (cycloisomerase 2 family)
MLKRVGRLVLVAMAICGWLSCGKDTKFSSTNTMYVASQNAAQVWGYHANFNNGSLTPINGSPFAAEPASAILIDPSQTFAYLASARSNNILRFSFDLNGSLIPVTGNPVTAGTNPVAMAMDSAGKFLFVANQGSGDISVFAVASGASLTPVAGSPFSVAGSQSASSPAALAINPSGNFLYVIDQNNNVVVTYQVDSNTGALFNSNPNVLQPVLTGTAPGAIAVNPGGSFLYVANSGSNNVSGYKINTDGSLTAMDKSPFAAELGPVSLAIDPSGQFLYVVNRNSNQISGYRITSGSGDLSPTGGSPYNTGTGPLFVAISPTNKYLYVSNNSAASLSGYSIDAAGGALGPVSPTVTTAVQPAGIAFGK